MLGLGTIISSLYIYKFVFVSFKKIKSIPSCNKKLITPILPQGKTPVTSLYCLDIR